MSFSLYPRERDLWVGQFSLLDSATVTHGISTRFGGISRPPFQSLNLALHVGDDRDAVLENRRRFCAALGISATRICTAEQMHGDRVFRVREEDAGRGFRAYEDAISGTDALMTDVPGLPLFLCYADCTPILLHDPKRRVIALAHGGWRGTLKHIAAKTVRAMAAAFGTKPADCLAAIGPAIGAECYEVGEEVARSFREAYPQDADGIVHMENGRVHLALAEANRRQLVETGLSPDRIDTANVCTRCNAGIFYSYRAAAGRAGRFAAVIALN